MINRDIVPPIKILARMDALSNNQAIPPDKPLPIMEPKGPIAINVRGTMINKVTVGTTKSFTDECVTRSTAFST
ncbi:hypothetical protein D3C75_1234620 [compost metagenome]